MHHLPFPKIQLFWKKSFSFFNFAIPHLGKLKFVHILIFFRGCLLFLLSPLPLRRVNVMVGFKRKTKSISSFLGPKEEERFFSLFRPSWEKSRIFTFSSSPRAKDCFILSYYLSFFRGISSEKSVFLHAPQQKKVYRRMRGKFRLRVQLFPNS